MKQRMKTTMKYLIGVGLVALVVALTPNGAAQTDPVAVTVDLGQSGKPISPDLFGIFFEDLNYAADGGLYAELVQNRSFEYDAAEQISWSAITSWSYSARDGGRGSLSIETAVPVHPNNPHYAVVEAHEPGGGVGLVNGGFDGIPVRAGESFDFSVFARQLFTRERWGNDGRLGEPARLELRLETKDRALLGETSVAVSGRDWQRVTATIVATNSAAAAQLAVLLHTKGAVALDEISLFPHETFRHRPNGLRVDLAQAIADLHPKFMRFPGGCLVHGFGTGNFYRWKDSVGPVEQRRGQPNLWGYHQSLGLGYFEFFQFCEDIGAKPLPVVAAGVCCQNGDHQGGTGQSGLPLAAMPAYIQDVLDLIEWANGPTNSTWGAKRAAAGHPEPFHLQYLGVGNEDAQTEAFRTRFKMIHDAIKAKHPEITVVGTVGPDPSGFDYDAGWKFANEQRLEMVDEHGYKSPQWFWENLTRFDAYDRTKSKVYLGEYAAHDNNRANTLRSALAEAAYMTSLERNGDVVQMASYAPLLAKEGHTQWRPDLIYFNNANRLLTANYYVQQMFGQNQGDVCLPVKLALASPAPRQRGFLLGTWDTQVQFAKVKVTQGSQTLVAEPLDVLGTNWIVESGNWKQTSEGYTQSADGQPTVSRLATTIGQTDYTLTLKARKTGGQEGFLIGFGVTGPNSYYWWNLGGWGNRQHAVEKISDGAKTTISKQVAGTIESDRWYDIKIEVAGAQIKCWLDGVLIHDITDADSGGASSLAASCVKDSQTGDVIVKLVNSAAAVQTQVNLPGLGHFNPVATKTVLVSDFMAENTFAEPKNVIPVKSDFSVGNSFQCGLPAHSLTVIRIKTR
jgi:alpha-L-arabinofuranosidase